MPAITENFEAVEQAVLESPRGRWFLAEYSSRLRARETAAVVDQVKSLEAAVSANHDAIMSRLAQALAQPSQTAMPAIASPAPDLAPKHMKFFKQDEEIFEAAPRAAIGVVKPATPPPENKGAKLTITRTPGPSTAVETPPAQVEPPAPAVEPQAMEPGAVEPPVAAAPEPVAEAPPKRRIVIIRHKPGEEIDVPLENEMQAAG